MDKTKSSANSIGAVFLFITLVLLSVQSELALARTTTDPNHQGWTGRGNSERTVDWKPIVAKCEQCTKIVAQYNDTMQLLMDKRFSLHLRQDNLRANLETLRDGSQARVAEPAATLERIEVLQNSHRAYIQELNTLIAALEKQAKHLHWAINECERVYCQVKKPIKRKDIEIGGETTTDTFQPDVTKLFETYDSTWRGPFSTNCAACTHITRELGQIPGWVNRKHFELVQAEADVKLHELDETMDRAIYGSPMTNMLDEQRQTKRIELAAKLKKEIESYIRRYRVLLEELPKCELKYCPNVKKVGYIPGSEPSDTKIALGDYSEICPMVPSHQLIEIGPNSEVGSSANFKEKAKSKALGVATGAITSLLGIGRSGGSRDSGPTTYRDPVRSRDKTEVKSRDPKREIRAGGTFTPEGLLISTDIEDAPGKGTFHTIYLENPRGWRLMPIGLYLYEIWRNWSLNVSWTRDTYIDGEHVSHEQGGWDESWSELIASGEETIYGEVNEQPLWEQLGFNTTVSGARSLGTSFAVSPEMLQAEPIDLVIHVTDPNQDPVVTYPYIFNVTLDEDGEVVLAHTDETMGMQNNPCKIVSEVPDGTELGNYLDELAGGKEPDRIASKLNDSQMNYPVDLYGLYQDDEQFYDIITDLGKLIDFSDTSPLIEETDKPSEFALSPQISAQVYTLFGNEPTTQSTPDYKKPEFFHLGLEEGTLYDIWAQDRSDPERKILQDAQLKRIYVKRKAAQRALAASGRSTLIEEVKNLREQKTLTELDQVTLDDELKGTDQEKAMQDKINELDEQIEDKLRRIEAAERWVDYINGQAEVELATISSPEHPFWRDEYYKYEAEQDANAAATSSQRQQDGAPIEVIQDVQGVQALP